MMTLRMRDACSLIVSVEILPRQIPQISGEIDPVFMLKINGPATILKQIPAGGRILELTSRLEFRFM
jgi:hypothetical protein